MANKEPKRLFEGSPPPMTEEQKKNYAYIQELLKKIHAVEENPDEVPDSEIKNLTEKADDAIKDIEEHK